MRRSASWGAAGSAAFCAALLLSGCGSPAAAPATTPPDAAPASATASAGPTDGASATEGATNGAGTLPASPTGSAASASATVPAGWKSYTTADGTLTFDYPAVWTVAAADGGAALVSDYGKTMARLRTQVGEGPACTAKTMYQVYDSAPVPALARSGVAPRFTYESRANPAATDPTKSNTFAYGITAAPVPTGAEACPISHVFPWPPRWASFGGIYDPFDTTPGKPMYVDTPEAYKDTTEYKYIKQALMSLRPAGK